jgi:ABC-type nitrate/sulfonate/bicarbonate transport system permease component
LGARSRFSQVGLGTIGVLGALGLWEIGARGLAPASGALPPLSDIARAWVRLAQSGNLGVDVLATLRTLVSGAGAALVVSLPLGSLIGLNRAVRSMLAGPMEFLRTLPAYALIFVFISVFSLAGGLRAVVAWGTAGIALSHCAYAVAHLPRNRVLFYTLIGAPRAFLWRQIWLRALLVVWVDAVRIVFPVSLALTVVGELLIYGTSGHGLGGRLQVGLDTSKYAEAYAVVGTLGSLGVIGAGLLELVARSLRTGRTRL